MKQFYWNIAMIVMALTICINAYSYDFEINGIYYGYNAEDQTAYVTMGNEKYSGNVVIPESVTYKGRTMAVTAIGENAFRECVSLLSVCISKSIISIGDYSYANCTSLSSITIPNTVTEIGYSSFEGCKFTNFVIEDGNNGLSTHTYAFNGCSANAIYIGRYINNDIPFCYSTSTIVIGKGVNNIYVNFHGYIDYTESVKTIYCMSVEPCSIIGSFYNSAYLNATLYVPIGSKEKYTAADGWKNFFNIQEMDVKNMWNGNDEPTNNDSKKKCEKPTIRYSSGKLLFESATEGAICQSTITDSDITSYSGNEVQLGVTYNISVYATASGYDNSDVATATLCWIDDEPRTESIENGVSHLSARAVLIQANNGILSISGVENGTEIAVYSSSGMIVGSAKSIGESSSIATSLRNGEIAIAKIGDKAIKIIMK